MKREYATVQGGHPMGWGGFVIAEDDGTATFFPSRPPQEMTRSDDWMEVFGSLEEAKAAVGERYGHDLTWHSIPTGEPDPISWAQDASIALEDDERQRRRRG